jgi:hypothetical protein
MTILPDRLTFSEYAKLNYNSEDIIAELNASLERKAIDFQAKPVDTSELRGVLSRRLLRVDLESEMARRETLIAPVVFDLCERVDAKLKIEYPLDVSDRLRGTLDYYVLANYNLLVIEAKNADLTRGFTQLAAELIALDQWISEESQSSKRTLYGAVTTGEEWRFGCFQRRERVIVRDTNLYRVPADLDELMGILLSLLT